MNEKIIGELINALKEVRLNQREQLEQREQRTEILQEIKSFIQELKEVDGGGIELDTDKIVDEIKVLINPVDIKVDTIREVLTIKTDKKILERFRKQQEESSDNEE